jgi:PKD repeat protein
MSFTDTLLTVQGIRQPLYRRGLLGKRAMAMLSTLILLTIGLPFVAPVQAAAAESADPATVSADPLPTAQIDGVVWTQLIVGNTVYVGGSFANARPAGAAAGTNQTPRSNLLAYDLTTGKLLDGWAPVANAQVRDLAMSPDGSRLYVVGQFTTVDGLNRYRVVALNPTTGAVITTWAPAANAQIYNVVATDTTVYLAGDFSTMNGVARNKIAAVSATSGALLDFTADVQGGYGVRGMELSPDKGKVVIGGSFTSVNGSTNPGRGLAALDSATGTSMPWLINSVVRNAGEPASIMSLTSDGDSVYGTAFDYGGTSQDGFEGTFRASWTDGELVWLEDCHGDTYDVAAMGDVIYTASHAHYCGNIGGFPQTSPNWTFHHSLAFTKAPVGQKITPDPYGYRSFTGIQAPKLLTWFPNWTIGSYTGMSQAVWSVDANSKYVVYGGEFLAVQGLVQQGLVRFEVRSDAPNKIGPQVQGGAWKLSALSYKAGEARLSWQANHDPDSENLTYQVFRRDLGTTTPIYTVQQASTFWQRPLMNYVDPTVTNGSSYDYRVRVTDPDGNATQTDWTTVTANGDSTVTGYDNAVLASSPRYFWPLGETSGATAYDWAQGNDLTLTNTTRAQTGQNQAEPSLATQFSGTQTSIGYTQVAEAGPQEFTIEAWFNTTSTRGGKIVGFGNAMTGNSGSYDRHVYLSNSGQVTFGVYPGGVRTITSAAGYNNGVWHHVVASLGGHGQMLYVDGKLIGQRTDTTSAQAYDGYWRVGGDNTGSWTSTGSSSYLSGTIADVAVYDRELARSDVQAHWTASGRTSTLPAAPSDNYGKAVFDGDPTLYWRLGENSGSTAADSGMNGNTGTYRSSITYRKAGALAGVSNTAIGVNGSGYVSSTSSYVNPTTYAIEAWFKTTTTAGGKIVGFGSSQTGTSSNYDRHIYMAPDGTVKFGVNSGTRYVVASPTRLNDGLWHHVVAQQSAIGMQLFVDGYLVDSNTQSSAQSYTGYWRVGGDASWEGANYFSGDIDEVAIYGATLPADQVRQHHEIGETGTLNVPPTASFTSAIDNLKVDFDGTASSDSDGTIASYSWDFGDGDVGSGATASHTYANGGTYQVTLKVTDNRGSDAIQTASVTVAPPNEPPTADFTAAVDWLSVTLDASGSNDPDGTIEGYSWAFGDGGSAIGKQPTHQYSQPGDYEITLTVTDNRGGSATKTVAVHAEAPPNQVPVASFTAAVSDLSVAFDASASSDVDGTITGYAWEFGDGNTGSGKTVTHVYSAAGSFDVKLTVTDNNGAEGTKTVTVNVTEPSPVNTVAADAFGRSVSGGWGTADRGGAWTAVGGAPALSVADGKGVMTLAPSYTRSAMLSSVSSDDTVSQVSVAADKAFAGGPTGFNLIGRQVGGSNYAARVRVESGDLIRMYLLRDETALGGSYVLGSSYQAGQVLNIKLSVTGTSPTKVSAKVWVSGAQEPAAWNLTAEDSTAALQVAGSVGIKSQVASSSTNAQVVFSYDNYSVVTAGAAPPNQVPVASFTAAVSDLSVAFDASASSDVDGTITGYAWEFGDGNTGSGKTVTHVYSAAGSFDVKLTVTDNNGAKSSKTVTVEPVAPASADLAKDAFGRTVAAGWGNADLGGAWTAAGGAAALSVSAGKGLIQVAPSQTREARLNAVSTTNSEVEVTVSADQAAAGAAMHTTLVGRQVGGSSYGARLRVESNGQIRLFLLRDETALGDSYLLPNTTYAAGDPYHLKLSVTGTSPTTVAAKIWKDGSAEPSGWRLTANDTAAAMQASGGLGMKVYVGAASSNAQTTFSFDDYKATTKN